jgi:RNA-directed DNA polymerase
VDAVSDGKTEANSAAVPVSGKPGGATQAEEIRGRWSWTEPSIWTPRMLTALERGVKGGKWFSLIDKVYDRRNLFSAFQKVAGNDGAPGVDHVTIEQFEEHLVPNLDKLVEHLRGNTYAPQPIKRAWIPKEGSKELRPLGVPTVRDRVVQTNLRRVIEPIFERDFAAQSYGFRPGKGCKDALRRVDQLLKDGYMHVVDADLKSYFDTIPHDKLMVRVADKISDGRVLELIRGFLTQGVLEDMKEWTPESGSPQGAVISPLLSNIYLDPLDHLLAREGFQMVRYADDFVVLCRSAEDAQRALALVQQWVEANGLTLHPTKTRIVDANRDGFDFLGYRFCRGRRWPRPKSLAKFKATIRAKTKRTKGQSLSFVIADVNRTLRGWFEYFKHSCRFAFPRLDQWVRMRLRSLLRRRLGKRGRGRGRDHQRWPNAFFRSHGLYDLTTALALPGQPARR